MVGRQAGGGRKAKESPKQDERSGEVDAGVSEG